MIKTSWNIEKIKIGFERYLKENGRLPTAREVDKIDYLPTSRTIQREYGGLEKLRANLGFTTTHFGKGSSRSIIAARINQRGKNSEAEVKDLLETKFGKMFVHLERPFASSSKQRLDFYVFSPSGNFGVDVFYPQDIDSMVGSINSKQRTYKGYIERIYFVVANTDISQNSINFIVNNKKYLLPKNYFVVTLESFKSDIYKMAVYHVAP